jgi:hypothetical protein
VAPARPARVPEAEKPPPGIRRASAAGAILLLAAISQPATAQYCGTLAPGDRVRLTLRDRPPGVTPIPELPPGRSLEGILVHIDLEEVVLEVEGSSVEIPRWYVEAAEEWCRPEGGLGPVTSAVAGGLVGGIAAGAIAACLAEGETDAGSGDGPGVCHPDRNPDAVGKAAVAGLIVGALVGLAIGSAGPDRSWTPVPLELTRSPEMPGRWDIGVRIPVGGS